MDPHDIASGLAVILAAVSTVLTYRKKRGLSLTEIAVRAVAYGEQMGKTPTEKLKHAGAAAQRLDAGDNGKRDWSDTQLRVALEAEIQRSKQ
jgi:hypothetical protein